jgi:hypothetical protein
MREEWNLDDQGRLFKAMSDLDKQTKRTFARYAAAKTAEERRKARSEVLANRITGGIAYGAVFTACAMMGAFALASVGILNVPSKPAPTPVPVEVTCDK